MATYTIQIKRDTAANWNTSNRVLKEGEWGLDTTAKKVKIGDGSTPWKSLPYAAYTPAEVDKLLADAAAANTKAIEDATAKTDKAIEDATAKTDKAIETVNKSIADLDEAISKQSAKIAEVADIVIAHHNDIADIKNIVAAGFAERYFNVGDQLVENWAGGSTSYEVPHNIVQMADVELANGESAHGMYLQWAYSTPYSIPFDAYEAFYSAPIGKPAGTYNVKFAQAWSKFPGGTFQFTLTKPLPAGGVLTGFERAADNADVTTYRVKSYSPDDLFTPIETVTVTVGSEGENLGTMQYAKTGELNSMHRVFYGWNDYKHSAIRQWLNSAEDDWWTPQHKWDMPPAEAKTKPGFLSGYSQKFGDAMLTTRVRTALNTVDDYGGKTYVDLYDKVFLPSLEEEYINPQLANVEGPTWEYWKQATGRDTPTPWHKTFADGGHPVTYAINARTSAQYVRLRSASRNYGCYAWLVYASGYVANHSAYAGLRCAPACVIGEST